MSNRRISTMALAVTALIALAPGCKDEDEGKDTRDGKETDADCDVPDVGKLPDGNQNLCTSLASAYASVVDAHRVCTTDEDCEFYKDVGVCGTVLNDQLPDEHLAALYALEKGYACPVATGGDCPDAPDRVRCAAGVCQSAQ